MFAFNLPIPGSGTGDAVAAFDPTKTSSTRMAPKGACAWYNHATYGMQLYRQVKLTTVTVVGQVYQWDTSVKDNETCEVAVAASTKILTAGVAQTVFPTGVYCWLLVRGQGLGLSDGITAEAAEIQVATADGSISDAAASGADPGEYIGYAVAEIADNATGVCAFTIY